MTIAPALGTGYRIACAVLAAAAFALAPVSAYAVNACVAKSGVGGTGYTPDNGSNNTGAEGATPGGVGGTGSPFSGVGGTGNTPPNPSGVGGTGSMASGVGGTGAPGRSGVGGSGNIASGVGGTGKAVGVVGTITGFASICIDGVEVNYTPTTTVSVNGLPGSLNNLAVGQVVTVSAAGDGSDSGVVSGVQVSILNAVAGPIAAINASAQSFTVLGQNVRVTAQTLIADATGIKTFDFLQTGALVRVSGLRLANGDIVASRVETALSLDQASVLGPVTASDATGFSIYGLRVAYADVTGSSSVTSGEVMVSGILNGGSLQAQRISVGPSLDFAQQVDKLVLEGYIDSIGTSTMTVGGVSVSLAATPLVSSGGIADLRVNQRIQVYGRLLPDHSIVADFLRLTRDPLAPPAAASLFPPSKAKSLSFNKAADTRGVLASDDQTILKLSAAAVGTGGGTSTTTTTGPGTGLSGGGSGGNMGGDGVITPGGGSTTTKPATPKPVVQPTPRLPLFRFDTLEFRLTGMPRR